MSSSWWMEQTTSLKAQHVSIQDYQDVEMTKPSKAIQQSAQNDGVEPTAKILELFDAQILKVLFAQNEMYAPPISKICETISSLEYFWSSAKLSWTSWTCSTGKVSCDFGEGVHVFGFQLRLHGCQYDFALAGSHWSGYRSRLPCRSRLEIIQPYPTTMGYEKTNACIVHEEFIGSQVDSRK